MDLGKSITSLITGLDNFKISLNDLNRNLACLIIGVDNLNIGFDNLIIALIAWITWPTYEL